MLRPTTRSPVLVHNPADVEWFGQDRLLPELERVDRADPRPRSAAAGRRPTSCRRGSRSSTPPTSTRSRSATGILAAQLLAAADLWLFVTSAARYADQVPWDFLRQAAERSAAVAIVLDRTPTDAVDTVASHLARMLAARGLKDSPLFTVHEVPLDEDGLLPAERRSPRSGAGWPSSAADADARAGDGAADPRGRDPHPDPPHAHGRRRRARAGHGRRAAARGRRRGVRRGDPQARRRPPPTARCCAARCWRGGRSSSAPASC